MSPVPDKGAREGSRGVVVGGVARAVKSEEES